MGLVLDLKHFPDFSADIGWHGLCGTSAQGFIPALGMADHRVKDSDGACQFDPDGCYNVAHDHADTVSTHVSV
jgi:hypothetical protein